MVADKSQSLDMTEGQVLDQLVAWHAKTKIMDLLGSKATLYDVEPLIARYLSAADSFAYEVQRHYPGAAAAANRLRQHIASIRNLLIWQCNECGTLYRQDADQLAANEIPECPNCGSEDYEPS